MKVGFNDARFVVWDQTFPGTGIKKIYEITGQYDICVIVQAPTISEINACIDNLRKISGVTDTNTVIILKTIS